MPTHHVPKPHERPDVLVLVDGNWLPGEVLMQTQLDDETWRVQVQYRPLGTNTRVIDWFPYAPEDPAAVVRPDDTDYRPGSSGPTK